MQHCRCCYPHIFCNISEKMHPVKHTCKCINDNDHSPPIAILLQDSVTAYLKDDPHYHKDDIQNSSNNEIKWYLWFNFTRLRLNIGFFQIHFQVNFVQIYIDTPSYKKSLLLIQEEYFGLKIKLISNTLLSCLNVVIYCFKKIKR